MRKLIKPLLAICILGLALAGCTIVPGTSMSSSAGWFSNNNNNDTLSDKVKVIPIGTSVLTQKDNAEPINPPATLEQQPKNYEYKVGIGDVLQITVWDHPELTIPAGSMRSSAESGNVVHNDGTIFYPYVGKIHVAGLEVTQIRKLITKRISKYIQDPQVDVSVAAFRSQRVYVTGAVNKPGALPITNVPMHLLDAVNAAGGLAPDSDWTDVTLSRDGKDYHLSLKALYQDGDAKQNVLLLPGDVIHVAQNDNDNVFVLGAVPKPQPVPMTHDGLTLAGALTAAGGFNQDTADASGVFVLRKAPPGSKQLVDVYQLNAQNATALVLADSFQLHRRDIVFVTSAPIALWNRVINNILPTFQTVYYGALAADRVKAIQN